MPRADPLRELARLARFPDQQCHNIGLHLRAHAGVLGPALGVEQDLLQAWSDQSDILLAPKVQAALRRMKEAGAVAEQARRNQTAHAAATELAARARRNCVGILLDPAILLSDLLADDSMRWIAFCLPGAPVHIARGTLVSTARVVGHKPGLSAAVDRDGLHLRWPPAGGLNWHPQPVSASEYGRVLCVDLRAPAPSIARSSSWSWDAFADVAL